jgi:hypothetical protein
MRAVPLGQPGWIFEIEDRHEGAPTTAEIVEVLHVPGYEAYRVRWADGSESTLIPSGNIHARPRSVGRRDVAAASMSFP